MERRNLALLCAGVVCFWLFALAFGTAQGKGLRIQPAVQTQAELFLFIIPIVLIWSKAQIRNQHFFA